MAAKTKTLRKKKKSWYTVIAPDIFKNVELGEVTAYAANALIGRTIKLGYSTITNSPRDKNKIFVLKIVKVAESKAFTEPVNIIFSASHVGRISRGSKTKILFVSKQKTKNKSIIIKGYILSNKSLTSTVKTSLKKQIDQELNKTFNKIDSTKLFEINYTESLVKDLKNKLKTIYPIKNILFWKILENN